MPTIKETHCNIISFNYVPIEPNFVNIPSNNNVCTSGNCCSVIYKVSYNTTQDSDTYAYSYHILWCVLWILIDLGVVAIFYGALVVIIVTIAIFITYMKTPKFIDNFYIRSELRLITVTVAFGIISFLCIWSIVGYIESITACSAEYWAVILVTNSYAIAMSANTLVQTKYVFYKCKDILHIASPDSPSSNNNNNNNLLKHQIVKRIGSRCDLFRTKKQLKQVVITW